MGLLTKEVEVVVNSRNVKYYEDLGYDIPKYYNKNKKKDVYIRGAKFRVNVNDLSVGSNYRVECECEVCKGHSSMSWQTYIECNHNGKTYCKHCASKFFLSGENSPWWKYDKTDEERKNDRSYPEYNIFIKSVLARDNYTCQCCNKSGIEMVVRGRSDISMIICAGIIGVIVGLLNDIFSYDMLIQTQLFIGSVVATVCEGVTGLILVGIYGYNPVWDYSDLWGNFFWGQCNIWFCVIWVGLVFVAILIADSIDYYLFDGERPYYKVSKDKVWFMLPEK